MAESFQIFPIGSVKKRDDVVLIEIHEDFSDGLMGLEQFSHIIILTWFHKNDTQENREILNVHPRGDKSNPLTGVFATRSPVRPNLISLNTCKILDIHDNIVRIDEIDAFDGTPVIDIKPCISQIDFVSEMKVPDWVDSGRVGRRD